MKGDLRLDKTYFIVSNCDCVIWRNLQKPAKLLLSSADLHPMIAWISNVLKTFSRQIAGLKNLQSFPFLMNQELIFSHL